MDDYYTVQVDIASEDTDVEAVRKQTLDVLDKEDLQLRIQIIDFLFGELPLEDLDIEKVKETVENSETPLIEGQEIPEDMSFQEYITHVRDSFENVGPLQKEVVDAIYLLMKYTSMEDGDKYYDEVKETQKEFIEHPDAELNLTMPVEKNTEE
jgi:hypothetical protein